jgi:hypothetical protein
MSGKNWFGRLIAPTGDAEVLSASKVWFDAVLFDAVLFDAVYRITLARPETGFTGQRRIFPSELQKGELQPNENVSAMPVSNNMHCPSKREAFRRSNEPQKCGLLVEDVCPLGGIAVPVGISLARRSHQT